MGKRQLQPLYSEYSLKPRLRKVARTSEYPGTTSFDSTGDYGYNNYSNLETPGKEYGTFISCALPASLLPRRTPLDTDMRILTQREQEAFWLEGLPISMEHNWGLDKHGNFDVMDPTVKEYNPTRGGSTATGDILVGKVVEHWTAPNGNIMTKNRLFLNDSDSRVRLFAVAAHEFVKSGYYPEVSLTHVTDVYPGVLAGGSMLVHTPVELTLTRAGYRSRKNGFSDNCTIYGVDGVDNVPIHLQKPLERSVREVAWSYLSPSCCSYKRALDSWKERQGLPSDPVKKQRFAVYSFLPS